MKLMMMHIPDLDGDIQLASLQAGGVGFGSGQRLLETRTQLPLLFWDEAANSIDLLN
jgi:hypothetical protein